MNGSGSANYCQMDGMIYSENMLALKKKYSHGGQIVGKQEQKIEAGELTIFLGILRQKAL